MIWFYSMKIIVNFERGSNPSDKQYCCIDFMYYCTTDQHPYNLACSQSVSHVKLIDLLIDSYLMFMTDDGAVADFNLII